jgi:hypothetical protein
MGKQMNFSNTNIKTNWTRLTAVPSPVAQSGGNTGKNSWYKSATQTESNICNNPLLESFKRVRATHVSLIGIGIRIMKDILSISRLTIPIQNVPPRSLSLIKYI